MRGEAVAIEELVLRLPGVARAEAPALAEEILCAAQERLRGTGRVGRLARVDLRVRVPAGLSRAALVARIVDELVEVMR
ncbi:MAG: hypothetical protein K8W52_42540 [Deltaproteobacteria bacterium]|nr:hypothetical protein [Deltaproteobacteria bacterium]